MIINRIEDFSYLISPARDINRPVYNWHSFKHSYSKTLVDNLISEFRIKKGAWVMDSFCGGGTTLLACKQAGINSQGFDILPFSVFLSNVKTRNYVPAKLIVERDKFKVSKSISAFYPALTNIPIAQKAFTPSVREVLIQIKKRIEDIKDVSTRNFFNLGLLSILESVSNTTKSGGFLRIINRRVKADTVLQVFNSRIDKMISDVQQFNIAGNSSSGRACAKYCDARDLKTERTYNAIITSPPYPNRHDYSRIYSLEMLFDFVNSNDDLKKIRYETLRSHVEAKKKYESTQYTPNKKLQGLIAKVRKNGVNNSQVIGMLQGYFEDMYLAINEMQKCLEDKGKIALVVSNVRFAGINIPVDEILSEAGEQAGLKPEAIWIARYRGNSSQQMKVYDRNPSRESIVVWKK